MIKKIIKKIITISTLILVIILLIILCSKLMILWNTGSFIGDGFEFQGSRYQPVIGHCVHGNKAIGHVKGTPIFDGYIYTMINDNSGDFIYVSDFTDQNYYIKEGVDIPSAGEITGIIVNRYEDNWIDKEEDQNIILSLEKLNGETYKKEDIPVFENNIPHNYQIFYCYNGCPLSNYYAGSIRYLSGKWIYFSSHDPKNGVVIKDNETVDKLVKIFKDLYIDSNQ